MTNAELRTKVSGMSKEEMIELRDHMEANYNPKVHREPLAILSIACINKFGVPVSQL